MVGVHLRRQGRIRDLFAGSISLGCPGIEMPIVVDTLVAVFHGSPCIVAAGCFGDTREVEGQVEIAEENLSSEAVGDSRHVGVEYRRHVFFVDIAVAVEVLIEEIAHARHSDLIHGLGSFKLFLSIDEAIAVGVIDFVAEILTDAVAGHAIAVGEVVRADRLVHIFLSVLVVCEVAVDGERPVGVDGLAVARFDFKTAVVYNSHVYFRKVAKRNALNLRHRAAVDKDVFAVLAEIIERKGQFVEQPQVDTVVLLVGYFPRNVFISEFAHNHRLAASERGDCASAHRDVGDIEEAGSSEFIVADFSVGCAQLQH